jgi:hypothetical protein
MLTEALKCRMATPDAPPCGEVCLAKTSRMAKLYEKLLVILTMASCSGIGTLAMLASPKDAACRSSR